MRVLGISYLKLTLKFSILNYNKCVYVYQEIFDKYFEIVLTFLCLSLDLVSLIKLHMILKNFPETYTSQEKRREQLFLLQVKILYILREFNFLEFC